MSIFSDGGHVELEEIRKSCLGTRLRGYEKTSYINQNDTQEQLEP
jgi:hypothetical protein